MQRLTRYFRRPATISALPVEPASRWPLYVGVFLGIWLSLYLYADTLSLPYLQEDSAHIRWLSWHNPIEPFLTAEGAPAYRPLGKSIIKVWYLVQGHHDRAWLRFHNIVLNILNIALIGKVAVGLDRSRLRYFTGGLAATFFSALPFAYQAVPWINNFFYPMVDFLLLLMVAVYWRARLRQSRRLLFLAIFLCFLAPFEIEYGIMGAGLLLAMEFVLWQQKRQPYPWLGAPLLGVAANALFVWRWFTIPKETYSFGLPTVERVVQIGAYFLQGLMYPISALARPLMELSGLNDLASIALVSFPVLAILVAFLIRRRQGPILIFALLWFFLLNLPALVFVNTEYVINSPRLLYPPGAGAVWLWAVFLVGSTAGGRWRLLKTALAGVFVLAVIVQGITFVRNVMALYHLAERPAHQLAAFARQAPSEDPLLVVNFPSWLAHTDRTFAMGNHGAQIIPFYVGIEELIYAYNDIHQPARSIKFPNIRQSLPYYADALGETVDYDRLRAYLLTSGDVLVTQWGAEEINLVPAGRATSVGFGQPTATFGDVAVLELAASQVRDHSLSLTLHWQFLQTADADYTVFLHLYSQDGALVSQQDGYPLMGLAPFWMWDANQTLEDRRVLSWPVDTPGGEYRVGLGVYDAGNGLRLPAQSPSGEALPGDTAILLSLHIDERHAGRD